MTEKEKMKPHITFRDEDVAVQLTDVEKGAHGIKIGDMTRQLKAIEAEKAATLRSIGLKLKEKSGVIDELSRELEEGVMKKMKVKTVYDFEANKVQRFIEKTGDLIGERQMNDVDRQLQLNLQGGNKKPDLKVAPGGKDDGAEKPAAEKKK